MRLPSGDRNPSGSVYADIECVYSPGLSGVHENVSVRRWLALNSLCDT